MVNNLNDPQNWDNNWDNKRYLLIIVGLGCFILAYCGSQNIPYTQVLPLIGGGAYALNFLINLAK